MTFTQALIRYLKNTHQVGELVRLKKSGKGVIINSIYFPLLMRYFKFGNQVNLKLNYKLTINYSMVVRIEPNEYDEIVEFCDKQGLIWQSLTPFPLFNPYSCAPQLKSKPFYLYVKTIGTCTWSTTGEVGAMRVKDFKEVMLRHRQNLDKHAKEIFNLA